MTPDRIRLRKVATSHVLTVPASYVQRFGWDVGTEFDLTVDANGALHLEPVVVAPKGDIEPAEILVAALRNMPWDARVGVLAVALAHGGKAAIRPLLEQVMGSGVQEEAEALDAIARSLAKLKAFTPISVSEALQPLRDRRCHEQ